MTRYSRPQLLDAGRHHREGFDSGEPSLDSWLHRYAGQNRRGNTAATWVMVDAAENVVAFASLSMTGIGRSAAPARLAAKAPDPMPALLVGRLAVDHRHGGLGVGSAMVKHVLATALELNVKAACRAVVVDALHDGSRSWWEGLGFVSFDPADPGNLDLYLLVSDIETTLAR